MEMRHRDFWPFDLKVEKSFDRVNHAFNFLFRRIYRGHDRVFDSVPHAGRCRFNTVPDANRRRFNAVPNAYEKVSERFAVIPN